MFGGFPFGDDFFGGVHQQMRRQMRDMDRMMNQMMDPFGVFDHRMGRAIENVGRRGNDDLALMSPFGGFGGLFGGMFDHMQNLETAAMNDPNSHIFSHSTMITFDGTNGNQPRVVEKSVRKTGDIKETRHSVRTGEQGVGDRMSIEHTIGDRTHIIEKQRDRSGRIREKQRFINLDEEEAKDFDREFTNRARYNLGTRRSHTVAAIEGREREPRQKGAPRDNTGGAPIITLPDEEDESEFEDTRTGNSRSRRNQGPIIQEVTEDSGTHKKRKGPLGRLFRANDE